MGARFASKRAVAAVGGPDHLTYIPHPRWNPEFRFCSETIDLSMNIARRRIWIPAAVACLVASGMSSLCAQDDPFNPAGSAAPPRDPAVPAGEVAEGPVSDLMQIDRPDPVVDAIIASDPQSPFELIRVIGLLLDIDRDDLASDFARKLLDLSLSDEQNYDLYKQAGSDNIFRLGGRAAMGDVGGQLARSILDGADRYASDADRIQKLAESAVRMEDKYQRSLALSELRLLGDVGAATLIQKLVDPEYQPFYTRIRQAIRLFGNSAEGPLLAASQSNSLKLRVEALYLMRYLRTPYVVESLMTPMLSGMSTDLQREVASQSLQQATGRLPDRIECQTRLFESARRYLMDQVVLREADDDLVKWWRWDATQRVLTPTWLSSRTVARIRGFQLAKDLVELDPESRDYQRLYWLTRLETAKMTAGVNQPLPQSVLDSFVAVMDPAMAREVLDDALRLRRVPAAVAACELMGAMADRTFLSTDHGGASPLVRALTFGSLRLKAAASEAIFRIDPVESFAGSSDYLSALVYLARSRGIKTAIVGHVNLEMAQSVAALVSRMGYTARPATSSGSLFEQAKDDPDLQLIIVTDQLSHPDFSELTQALRSHPRTTHIPLLLMVEPDNINRAERVAERLDNIQVSPSVANELVIRRQIDNLLNHLDYQDATQLERGDFGVRALEHLSQYASQPERYPFFDLLNQQELLMGGLDIPATAADTCRVLGELGTAAAQTRLLETASNLQLPVALRRIAADSFSVAVEKRGLMMSRNQILGQYARYNASANEPAESQQILGELLDILESKTGD